MTGFTKSALFTTLALMTAAHTQRQQALDSALTGPGGKLCGTVQSRAVSAPEIMRPPSKLLPHETLSCGQQVSRKRHGRQVLGDFELVPQRTSLEQLSKNGRVPEPAATDRYEGVLQTIGPGTAILKVVALGGLYCETMALMTASSAP